jgi:hypothetical protein
MVGLTVRQERKSAVDHDQSADGVNRRLSRDSAVTVSDAADRRGGAGGSSWKGEEEEEESAAVASSWPSSSMLVMASTCSLLKVRTSSAAMRAMALDSSEVGAGVVRGSSIESTIIMAFDDKQIEDNGDDAD